MKGLKNISGAVLIFTSCNFLSAQPQSSLLDFYTGLAFSQQGNNDALANSDLRTSNFYPLKATNYIWNGSAWNFTDTTLYTYTASNKVASLTEKDNFNNFILRVLNSYDATDNLTEALHQDWSAGWVNDFRDTFAFDSYNSLTLQEIHQWNTSQWVRAGGYRYFYTYNAGGKILTKLTVSWNTTTLVWDSVSRITNTYNGNDQVIQTIRESYNLSAWGLTSRTDYTYDASFVNTQTTNFLWSGSQWDNNTRLINIVWNVWTGDVNTSRPQSFIYQLWNVSTWDDYNRLTYTYDAFGSVIQFTELFVSGNWRNDTRLSEFYDSQYNYTGIRSEAWNIFVSVWDTLYEYKYNHTYDVNNSIIETIYQEYDVPNHIFENDSRTVYSDFILLDVEENISLVNPAMRMYPNPVTDFAEVTIAVEKNIPFQWSIYDSTGKLVLAGKETKNNFRIHREDLEEGLYLLLLSDGQGMKYVLKFIVQ